MTTDLEPRIRELFRDLADRTSVTPDVLPATASARGRRRGRPRWVYLGAAAATLALITAGAVVRVNRDTTPAGPAPAPGEPVGIFPAGDAERVAAVGFQTPVDLAVAYVVDRLGFDAEPPTDTTVMEITGLFELDEQHVAVYFSVYDTESSSRTTHGVIEVERVDTADDGSAWAVTVAQMGGADARDVRFHDGTVEGEFLSAGGGARTVSALVPLSGDEPSRVEMTSVREGPANEPEADEFILSGLETDAVMVRMENPVEPGASGQQQVFAPQLEFVELLIREGEQLPGTIDSRLRTAAAEVLEDVLIDSGPASVLQQIEPGTSRTIIDDDVVTVSIAVTGVNGFCVYADPAGSPPGDPEGCIEGDHAIEEIGPWVVTAPWTSQEHGVVVGLVPDSVGSVTDSTGREVTLVDNVWYDVATGTRHAYTMWSIDRTSSWTQWVGSITIDLGPARP